MAGPGRALFIFRRSPNCNAWPDDRAIDEDDLLGEQSSLRLRLATSTDGLFGPNDGIGGTPRYLSSKSFRIPHHTLLAQSHAADAI
jgi:hypothetical protein